ncbi:hypothetical protein [Pengzhenrongella phosphoraccumulans]|uniref:hypothetical protein n=1 Tax=Pengzhenrongella phosphoraccumulans TaxID=3114394 RepID=UPI003890FC50
MRMVQPRQPWQIPIPADALVCSALAHSRQANLDAPGPALRSALVDRIVALDVDGDATERAGRLDSLPHDAGWSRWQTVVFAGRAWDDDRAIDLAFALWDVIGEATYREVIRDQHRRLTAAERYAWPGVRRTPASDDPDSRHAHVRPVAVGRWAIRDLPRALFADLDTGSMGARARLMGAALMLLGIGAGVGAGIAALLGRSVETGVVVGVIVGVVVVVLYLLFVLSLIAGAGLMSLSRAHMKIDLDEQTRARGSVTVARLWVGAAFAGIVTALAAGTLAMMWFQERPYQGAMEQTTGTVLSWDDGHRYRLFQLEYEAMGTVRTGQASADQLDLRIDTKVGDAVALEYPVGNPDRIRGASRAAEGRQTNTVFAWISAVGAGVAVGCAATAIVFDLRRLPGYRWVSPPPPTKN